VAPENTCGVIAWLVTGHTRLQLGGGAGDGGRKERTRADCTNGTGKRTEKDGEGKKEEAKRKRSEDGKKEKGENKKAEEWEGAEKRESGTVVREGVEEGAVTVTEGGVEIEEF
jgi:hypothetical protein